MDINLVAHLSVAGAELDAALEMIDEDRQPNAFRNISRALAYVTLLTECAATGTWPTVGAETEDGADG